MMGRQEDSEMTRRICCSGSKGLMGTVGKKDRGRNDSQDKTYRMAESCFSLSRSAVLLASIVITLINP